MFSIRSHVIVLLTQTSGSYQRKINSHLAKTKLKMRKVVVAGAGRREPASSHRVWLCWKVYQLSPTAGATSCYLKYFIFWELGWLIQVYEETGLGINQWHHLLWANTKPSHFPGIPKYFVNVGPNCGSCPTPLHGSELLHLTLLQRWTQCH